MSGSRILFLIRGVVVNPDSKRALKLTPIIVKSTASKRANQNHRMSTRHFSTQGQQNDEGKKSEDSSDKKRDNSNDKGKKQRIFDKDHPYHWVFSSLIGLTTSLLGTFTGAYLGSTLAHKNALKQRKVDALQKTKEEHRKALLKNFDDMVDLDEITLLSRIHTFEEDSLFKWSDKIRKNLFNLRGNFIANRLLQNQIVELIANLDANEEETRKDAEAVLNELREQYFRLQLNYDVKLALRSSLTREIDKGISHLDEVECVFIEQKQDKDKRSNLRPGYEFKYFPSITVQEQRINEDTTVTRSELAKLYHFRGQQRMSRVSQRSDLDLTEIEENLQKACQDYETALKYDPGNTVINSDLGFLLNRIVRVKKLKGDSPDQTAAQALACHKRAYDHSTADVNSFAFVNGYGLGLHYVGRYGCSNPEVRKAYYENAMGQLESAARKKSDEEKQDEIILLNKSALLIDMGNTTEAISILKEVAKSTKIKHGGDICYLLSLAHYQRGEQGDLDECRKYLNERVKNKMQHPNQFNWFLEQDVQKLANNLKQKTKKDTYVGSAILWPKDSQMPHEPVSRNQHDKQPTFQRRASVS
jgi:hypothetical protein